MVYSDPGYYELSFPKKSVTNYTNGKFAFYSCNSLIHSIRDPKSLPKFQAFSRKVFQPFMAEEPCCYNKLYTRLGRLFLDKSANN